MKKLLVVLGLAIAAFSFQAAAATYSLTNLTTAVNDTGPNLVANSEHVSGGFSTAWLLTSDADTKSLVTVTANPAFKYALDVLVNGINVLQFATSNLDKVFNLTFLSTDVVQFLVAGNAGRSGSIDISVSSVPVPAAVWLFGSALMGLIGASRRKNI